MSWFGLDSMAETLPEQLAKKTRQLGKLNEELLEARELIDQCEKRANPRSLLNVKLNAFLSRYQRQLAKDIGCDPWGNPRLTGKAFYERICQPGAAGWDELDHHGKTIWQDAEVYVSYRLSS